MGQRVRQDARRGLGRERDPVDGREKKNTGCARRRRPGRHPSRMSASGLSNAVIKWFLSDDKNRRVASANLPCGGATSWCRRPARRPSRSASRTTAPDVDGRRVALRRHHLGSVYVRPSFTSFVMCLQIFRGVNRYPRGKPHSGRPLQPTERRASAGTLWCRS